MSLSDLITSAILHASLCQECIAKATGHRQVEVVLALMQLSDMVRIETNEAPCWICGERTTVYRVE